MAHQVLQGGTRLVHEAEEGDVVVGRVLAGMCAGASHFYTWLAGLLAQRAARGRVHGGPEGEGDPPEALER